MTHEVQPGREARRSLNMSELSDGVLYNPEEALRASPVVAPYEETLDGQRSAEADEYDSGQLMIARLQAEEIAEVHGR